MATHKFTKFISASLPRLGFSCLALCLISGIILTFYYRPMGNVFQNVEEITTLVPFGKFFRQFHYGSGQLFVILMLLHMVDQFLRNRYRTYSWSEWTLLIITLCLCFFILFTGFVLKGDKEGIFAGRVFMNILKTVPTFGERLSLLFITPGEYFFFLPYLYHCFFLPLIVLYLIRTHIRKWFPDKTTLFIGTVGLFIFALVIEPYVDIPPHASSELVTGPWFFLGIQTLLKFISPFWAGLFIPMLFASCLIILPATGKKVGKLIHFSIIGLFFLYMILTIRAFLLGL